MHRLARERSEWSVDGTARFSCKKENDEFNVCGGCKSCLFPTQLYDSTEWLLRADESFKRRFLAGILVRCQSVEILENILNVLQGTLGKDFTYARSHVKASIPEDPGSFDSDGTLDPDLLRVSVRKTWDWFRNSPPWTKSRYLMRILSLCDTELVRMLGNLIRVLIARERRKFLQISTAKKDYWTELKKETVGSPKRKSSDADSVSSEDPALMVVPGSAKSMSGVSLHRDFIRGLPVNIAKSILGLLDKPSLQRCRQVSQHWQYLTEEILSELSVKKMVEDQAMVLQGSSCSGVNPAYAQIREVPVPFREEDDHIHPNKISPKYKKDIRGLESVYVGVKTKAVEMDERNVYCGAFNILVLLDREDPGRVVHYDGGRVAALGSRDRAVRLLDVPLLKEAPLMMTGHAGSVRAVLVCEERALVISASYDLTIRCWNLNTGACTMLFTGHTGTINCLDLHGHILVSGARDCKVKVWSLLNGQCLKRLRFRHHKSVQCVKIHTPVVLSGCEGGLIKMWDTETAALLKVMDGHQGSVRCLFFDQWHILSGGSDGQVLAWSTNSAFKKSLMTFPHPREVPTLSFHFLRVITGCADGKIRIFNFLGGDCLRVIKISTRQSTVLSLHTHHNNILVNSSSRVLLLQFAQERWDYAAEPMRTLGGAGICAPPRDHSMASSGWKVSRQSRGTRLAPSHHTRSCSAAGMQQQAHENPPVTSERVMTLSERAIRERVRKRGLHHPVTPAQVILKVSSPTQQPHSCDLASSVMKLNARAQDALGPLSLDPDRQQQTGGSSTPPRKTPAQPRPAPRPSKAYFEGMVKIYTPFRTHTVDLALRHSLHSGQIHSSVPSPKLFRPRSGRVGAITPTAEEDSRTLRPTFTRSAGKHPDHRVETSGIKPTKTRNTLDPFRERGGFQLRTDTEVEELTQAQLQADLCHSTPHPADVRDGMGRLGK
ncbi:CMT1A duplicated region transcript 1 protein [Electrophorus electricus]|uniref:CMT1A duplicated region transcript 1 protein n=1 Tax=Electrophorus electricus TaxID=8005 RepID=UPI0015D0BF53|nr:CMT1A duplicated region transcript 1 protein [Electrophorus electricus]